MRPPRDHSSTPHQSGREGGISTRDLRCPKPAPSALGHFPSTWSGWEDLNLHRPAPKAGGLPLPYIPKSWSGWPESNRSSRVWKTPTLPLSYSRQSWSGQRESNPQHPRWQRGIPPLNYDRSIWWTRGKSNPHFRFAGPECSRYHYAPKSGAQSGLGFRDLSLVGRAPITHLS